MMKLSEFAQLAESETPKGWRLVHVTAAHTDKPWEAAWDTGNPGDGRFVALAHSDRIVTHDGKVLAFSREAFREHAAAFFRRHGHPVHARAPLVRK